jgi:hypothetical protein
MITASHDNIPIVNEILGGEREADLDRLARVLYEEQERLLPEGDTWAEQNPGLRSYWRSCVKAILRELLALDG